jgi:hypothetical protein
MRIHGIDNEEQIIVEWQYHYMGGFYKTLMEAISLADEEHLGCLARAFPNHVSAYLKYSTESGWWKKVQNKLFALNLLKYGEE